MTYFLAQYSRYRDYESGYYAGWIIGFILHLLIALAIARLISWGIRVLLTKTVFPGKNENRRAIFVSFFISGVIAVLFAVMFTSGTSTQESVLVAYTEEGELRARFEPWAWYTVSLIYIGLLSVWLFFDLRRADSTYAEEISIFKTDAGESSMRPLSANNWATGQQPPPQSAQSFNTLRPAYQPPPPPMFHQPPAQSYPPPPPQPRYPQQQPPAAAAYQPPPSQAPPTMLYHSPPAPPPPPTAQTYHAAPPPPSPSPPAPPPTEALGQGIVDATPRPSAARAQAYDSEQASFNAAIMDLIKQLATLRDSGALSNEEFEQKKTELLKRI